MLFFCCVVQNHSEFHTNLKATYVTVKKFRNLFKKNGTKFSELHPFIASTFSDNRINIKDKSIHNSTEMYLLVYLLLVYRIQKPTNSTYSFMLVVSKLVLAKNTYAKPWLL